MCVSIQAVRWLMTAGFFHLVQITGLVISADIRILYHPKGQIIIFTLVMTGVSMSSLAHALAFRPIDETHRQVVQKLASLALAPIAPKLSSRIAPPDNLTCE